MTVSLNIPYHTRKIIRSRKTENKIENFMFHEARSRSVVFDNPFNPVDVVPHFGVDSREVRVSTADTPGDDAFQFAVTDKGTTRVTLRNNRAN